MTRSRWAARGRRGRLLAPLAAVVPLGMLGAFALTGTAAAAPGCPQSGAKVTCTFSWTGGSQSFTVPAGVSSLDVTAVGASGGGDLGETANPGPGASVEDKAVAVSAGQVLTVIVGGAGGTGVAFTGGAGGSPGGGAPGGARPGAGGGGGYSGLFDASQAALVIGAGGGGAAEQGNGGAGDTGSGGGAGSSNGACGVGHGPGCGGGGGTSTAVGTGGAGGFLGGSLGSDGSAGASLAGGQGGTSPGFAGGGGGGGGGNGGGGGGGGNDGGGGGGGSSYPATGLTNETATNFGNGQVTISYTVPLAVATTSLPAATGGHSYTATLAATGGVTPYSWSVLPGTLPPGLSLSAAGVISGIPDVAGTYAFTVTVTDAENPAMTAAGQLSITVSGPVITGLNPGQGPSFGGFLVKITGTGLSCPRPGGSSCRVSVMFGSHRAFVLGASPTLIGVIAPPGHGTVQVTVKVGGVSSQATAAGLFTYRPFPL
jgi:hypothetical protein